MLSGTEVWKIQIRYDIMNKNYSIIQRSVTERNNIFEGKLT